MSYQIQDIMSIDWLNEFEQVAGRGGNSNVVKTIGILEYELFEGIESYFREGDLVITTFFFAKDHEELLFESVEQLIRSGASGLAFKDIYYSDLPKKVIKLADEYGFPLYRFPQSITMESVITKVTDLVTTTNSVEYSETLIRALLDQSMDIKMNSELRRILGNSVGQSYKVMFLNPKDHIGIKMARKQMLKFDAFNGSQMSIKFLKLNNGMIIVANTDDYPLLIDKAGVIRFLREQSLAHLEFEIGISSEKTRFEDFKDAIEESIFTVRTSLFTGETFQFFNEIGVFKVLINSIDSKPVEKYCRSILDPIKEYDLSNNTQILETSVAFIKNKGDFKRTANDQFLHYNTVRYRITKAKEILAMEDEHGDFYEQLSIAIKAYHLILPINEVFNLY